MGHCTVIPTLWLSLSPFPNPLPPLLHVSGRSHQKHLLWHFFAHLDFLQINPFSSSPLLPSLFNNFCCRVCLLLSELPGNGTKKPREALPRSQAYSHRDICREKCSLFQQTAGVQRHKHAQINRLTPLSAPETRPRRQML